MTEEDYRRVVKVLWRIIGPLTKLMKERSKDKFATKRPTGCRDCGMPWSPRICCKI